jgi:hypothetical protein
MGRGRACLDAGRRRAAVGRGRPSRSTEAYKRSCRTFCQAKRGNPVSSDGGQQSAADPRARLGGEAHAGSRLRSRPSIQPAKAATGSWVRCRALTPQRSFCFLFSAPAKKEVAVKAKSQSKVNIQKSRRGCAAIIRSAIRPAARRTATIPPQAIPEKTKRRAMLVHGAPSYFGIIGAAGWPACYSYSLSSSS